MSDTARIITRRRDGFRFYLVASHFGTAPVGQLPIKADNCRGCGTARKVAP